MNITQTCAFPTLSSMRCVVIILYLCISTSLSLLDRSQQLFGPCLFSSAYQHPLVPVNIDYHRSQGPVFCFPLPAAVACSLDRGARPFSPILRRPWRQKLNNKKIALSATQRQTVSALLRMQMSRNHSSAPGTRMRWLSFAFSCRAKMQEL